MNDKQAQPELIINLDRPRRLCFNLYAMNVLTEHYEKTTGNKQIWTAVDWNNLDTRDITRILWAALLTDAEDHGETLTYENFSKMASLQQLIESMDVLYVLLDDLITRAMPVLSSDETKERLENLQKKTTALKKTQKQTTALIGSNSSQSPL